MEFAWIDPCDGRERERFAALDAAGIEAVLARADAARAGWAATPLSERAARLGALAAVLRARRDALALLATEEMGKRIEEARAEVEKSAWGCEHYAERAAAALADRPVAIDGARAQVVQAPLGTVLGVMPWNFPFWQALRAAAPTLAAGNCLVVKHAPAVPRTAAAIAACFEAAGFPPGVYQDARIPVAEVARAIADPRIHAVTLTGSARAGRAVAAAAGAALKKCVLELGGSDPFVVLEDADLARAAATAVRARFQNCGQSCIAAKRFVVVDAVAEEFAARFVADAAALGLGDPRDPATTLGPLARVDLRDALHAQVADAVAKGARPLLGGEVPSRPGAWYPATVLEGIAPGMRAWTEELFGPVASLVRVPDEGAALAVANATPYGLGGSVWTRDEARGERFARRLESGLAFVNGMVRSDPRLPFGGVKESGFGRELGDEGLREFVSARTLWLERT